MATFFRNKVIKSVGTVPVEIVTVASGSKVTAIVVSSSLQVPRICDASSKTRISA